MVSLRMIRIRPCSLADTPHTRVYKLAAVIACRASRSEDADSRMFACSLDDMRFLSHVSLQSSIADTVGELEVGSRRVLVWHLRNNGRVTLPSSRGETSRDDMLLSLRFHPTLAPKLVSPNSPPYGDTIIPGLGPFAALP